MPLFLLIMFAIIQFGFVFFVWNDMNNAAREGARRLSVDSTVSEAQAEAIVNNWLVRWPATFNVTGCKIAAETTKPSDCKGADSVSMTVTAPISQVSIINFIPTGLAPNDLRALVVMRKEGIP
jgi:Flp pilus assembly protein TadG